MGFSSGTFTYTTSGLPVVTGTTISSTVENAKNTETAAGLSTCLLKDGTQTTTANIPFAHAINQAKGTDIASAATADIGAATGNYVVVTGTTTITAFGT